MLDTLKIQRNVRGEWVMEIQTTSILSSIFAKLEAVYLTLDKFLMAKPIILAAAGAGLGVGLTLITAGQPSLSQATPLIFPQVSSAIGVDVQSIKFPSLGLGVAVTRSSLTSNDLQANSGVVQELGSVGLGQPGAVLIKDNFMTRKLAGLNQVELGDQIILRGQNNGIYKYKVTEIRVVASQNIANLAMQLGSAVMIYTPKNLVGNQLLVVVARPE